MTLSDVDTEHRAASRRQLSFLFEKDKGTALLPYLVHVT